MYIVHTQVIDANTASILEDLSSNRCIIELYKRPQTAAIIYKNVLTRDE